jgi:SNF2 family DNA or RNA helicase
MKRTWAREIEQWWPGVPVYVVQGTKVQRQKILAEASETPGFVIINWESVRLHSRLAPYGTVQLRDCTVCNRRSTNAPSKCERCLRELNHIPFKLAIIDEAHRMQDPQSKQTRAVWSAGGPAQWKWALTGTPLTKTPETIYPILHFLHPEEWPTKTGFINRYTDNAPSRYGPGLDIFGLNENTKEEFFEIFDPRFRRMPKEVVLPQLPPIQYVRRDVEMSDEQARAYRTMAEDMVARDENGELIIAVNPISKLTRTIQYSSATLVMNDEGMARMTAPSCKLDQLMADLDDYLSAEESIVVFAVHRQLIELAEIRLKEKKIPYSVIKGGQNEADRTQAIDDFQAGRVPVILVVIAAGGVGITLTTGRIAIFLQRPWSNVDHQQAMGRVHRIGSEIHDSVIIVDYVTQRTVENYQLRALAGKAQQLEAVVRDAEAIERILNGEEE